MNKIFNNYALNVIFLKIFNEMQIYEKNKGYSYTIIVYF